MSPVPIVRLEAMDLLMADRTAPSLVRSDTGR
jgi:hypothetical protein